MTEWIRLPLIGWGVLFVIMTVLWLVQKPMKNAGIVDAGWSLGLAFLAGLYAVAGDGDPVRRAILAAIVGVWGMRLTLHLMVDRVIGKPEDGRYQAIRAERGSGAEAFFFLFFQAQGLLDVVLSLPFLLAAMNPAPAGIAEAAAVVLWITGIAGESIADRQLARFRANPANRGRTCREGLWRYSRHPNYFFEWLMWCAYALLAITAPFGWAGLLSPLLMLFFLFRVTGIPATEAQALRSRGDDYRRYQQSTSVFVPWFPGRSAERGAAS